MSWGPATSSSDEWGPSRVAGTSDLFGQPALGASPAVYIGEPAGPGKRFGAMLLEIPLAIVTLGIGWVVWDLIAWSKGQSPAKQLLGMRIVDATTGVPINWG